MTPEYLRQTVAIKEKHIDGLLDELRQANDTYQRFKAEYLQSEQHYEETLGRLEQQIATLEKENHVMSHLLQKHKLEREEMGEKHRLCLAATNQK